MVRSFLAALAIPAVAEALQAQSRTESCSCLGWEQAFTEYGADCSALGEELCDKFLKKISSTEAHFTMNKFIGEDATQWCYVSADCNEGKDLEWSRVKPGRFEPLVDRAKQFLGLPATKRAKWLKDPRGGRSLGDFSVEELVEFCERNDLDVGLVAQFAYHTFTEANLPTIYPYFGFNVPKPSGAPDGYFSTTAVSYELKTSLDRIQSRTRPVFIKSKTGHPPFAIMEGKKTWWLNFGTHIESYLEHKMGNIFDHPFKINEVRCVQNCDGPGPQSNPWWSKMDSQ